MPICATKPCRRIIKMPSYADISIWQNPQAVTACALLAQQLSLPLQKERKSAQLAYINGALYFFGDDVNHGLSIDFCQGQLAHRRQFGGGRGQALARAMGMRANVNPQVIDLTAGLGRDAFVLASLGAKVTMVERQPIIHALLADALKRARQNPQTQAIVARLKLVFADGKEFVQTLKPSASTVIYLDPMYPERQKSALVKKNMRELRALCGSDADSALLAQTALLSGAARVVVKRPKNAPALVGSPPAAVASKNTRYDIYPRCQVEDGYEL